MILPDKPTLALLNKLHPKLRAEALAIYAEICAAGLSIRVTFTLRTVAEQDCLYAQGRQPMAAINALRQAANLPAIGKTDAATRVTKASGGLSWHNYGLALDIALLLDNRQVSWNESLDLNHDGMKDWIQVTQIFMKHGWEWGGGPAFIKAGIRDAPHYQKRFGLTIRQALARYQAGQRTNGYINL